MAALKKHVCKSDREVEELLKKYRELELDKDTNKIKCCLSGHEMPSTKLAITTYVSGKKFLKLKAVSDYVYDDYAEHLVPSTKKFHKKHLYCRLTQIHVNHTPKDIERHINGRKFKRAVREWKRCQETGEKFKPFGNLQKQQQNDEDNMSDNDEKFSMFGNISTKGSKVKNPVAVSSSAVGDGGFLDIDSEEEDRPRKDDDDNFSDLYPDEDDDNEKVGGGGGSGSDFDFGEMDVVQNQTAEDKPKKLAKSLNGKKHQLPLPQKKKVKRLKTS